MRRRVFLTLPRWCAAVAGLACVVSSTIASAEYVAPASGGLDPNDPEVQPGSAPKPGRRKFYVVEV
ncbi:MAG: hypothetical protein ABI175_17900, partial [Polyangiales bacterium]